MRSLNILKPATFLPMVLVAVVSSNQSWGQNCVPPPAGAVGWWPGDGDANDLIAGNHGTLLNGAGFAPGMVGQAFSFDGVDDIVTIPHSAALNAFPLTVEFWMKTSTMASHPALVNKYVAASTNGYQVFMRGGDLCAWYFRDFSNYVTDDFYCGFAVPGYSDDQWHHVAFAVDATGGRVYADGSLRDSLGWTGTPGPPTTTRNLSFGYYPDEPLVRNFLGLIDEIQIYSRALTPGEVQSIYTSGSAGKCRLVANSVVIPYNAAGYKYLQVPWNSVSEGWYSVGFDDTGWSVGSAGFGTLGCPLTPVTYWALNTDLLLRKKFNLSAGARNLRVRVAIDNDIQVYINGVQIGPVYRSGGCARLDQHEFFCPDSLLLSGENLIAVRAHDYGGVAYVDVNVVVDIQPSLPPSTVFTCGPEQDQHLNDDSIAFCWTGSDERTPPESLLYAFRLDTFPFGAFTSDTGTVLFGFVEGAHTFEAKARDADGNVDSTPASRSFVSDFTSPSTTVQTSPADGDTIPTPSVQFCLTGSDNFSTASELRYAFAAKSDSLGGFGPSACTTIAGLPEGPHRLAGTCMDKAGNVDFTPVQVNFVVAFVDLQTVSLSVPDSGLSDRPIALVWEAANSGAGIVRGPWTDRVWLSPDPAFGSDILVGDVTITDTVRTGENYVFNGTLVLPYNVVGDFWLIVELDAGNVVPEQGAESNNFLVSGHQLHVSLPRHPDLRVSGITVPSEGWTGRAIEVEWTISNYGDTTASGTWAEDAYLSADSAGGVFADRATFVGEVAAAASYTRSRPLFLPDAPGRYWVIVRADADNQVREFDREENNSLISAQAVTVRQSPYPDLIVATAQAPPAATSGQSIDVDWTVGNQGTGATDASIWYDWLYLSSDGTLSGDDRYLGSFQNFSYLDTGQNYARTGTVTLPWELSGTYYVLVVADGSYRVAEASGESNNSRSTGPIAVSFVLEPLPYLEVTSIVAPDSVWPGDTVTARWVVTNTGTAPACTSAYGGGSWDDGMALSVDPFFDGTPTDTWLGSHVFHNVTLYPGQSDTVSAVIALPATVSGPQYLIIIPDTHRFTCASVAPGARLITLYQKPPADLEFVSLNLSPAEISSGDQVLVSWTVKNGGLASTLPLIWSDAVYLSRDTVLNTSEDEFLADAAFSGDLAVDSSYSRAVTVTIPNEDSGSSYFIVCTDIGEKVYEGPYEGNNCTTSTAIDIAFTPPDLEVTQIILPGSAWSGQSAVFQWSVVNRGPGRTAPQSWTDELYLSDDDTLEPSGDIFLGAFSHGSSLDSGGSYIASPRIRLLDGLNGNFYVFVVTDADSQVYEANAENNNVGQSSLVINLTPPPDLQVPEVLLLGEALAGLPASLQWRVANLGTGATLTDNWNDRIYWSEDSTTDVSSDSALSTVAHAGALTVGQSYLENRNIALPAGDTGRFYVKLRTDADSRVYEHTGEGNNVAVIPVHVSLPNSNDLRLANLMPSDLQAAGTLIAGDTFTVSWTVRNTRPYTANPQAGFWEDALYLSQDDVLDTTADQRLGRVNHFGSLALESSYAAARTVVCPDGVTGARYLFVATDHGSRLAETNESDNASHLATSVLLLPPDLRVDSVIAPDSADAGQPAAFRWVVRNWGVGETKVNSWFDAVYLSRDQLWDGFDINLGSQPRRGRLKADSSYETVLAATIPAGLSGPYYVIVRTDKNNQVFEGSAETNNSGRTPLATQVVLPLPVNLTVTAITAPPAAIAGHPITITWTVTNTGANDVDGQWTDAVYLSADTIWEYTDPVVGTASLTSGLKAGKSYTRAAVFDVGDFFGTLENNLPGVVPGDYRVFVRSDIRNNINETNEMDNLSYSTADVTVDVQALALGVPFSDSVDQNEQRYYRVTVGGDNDLRLRITPSSAGDEFSVFGRSGASPDRVVYDFTFPVDSGLDAVVPCGAEVVCYLMVRGDYVTGSGGLTLTADSIPFQILSVKPNRIGNDGQVTITVLGAGFEDSASLALIGPDTLRPSLTLVESGGKITARFRLISATMGDYVALVTNFDGTTARLEPGVTVEMPTDLDPLITIDGPAGFRAGDKPVYNCRVSNPNNVDIEYLRTIVIAGDPGVSIEFLGAPFPQIIVDGVEVNGTTPIDGYAVRTELLLSVAAEGGLDYFVRIGGFGPAPFGISFALFRLDRDSLVAEYLAHAAEIRDQLLSDASLLASLTGEERAAVEDPQAWNEYYAQTLLVLGKLNPLEDFGQNETATVSSRYSDTPWAEGFLDGAYTPSDCDNGWETASGHQKGYRERWRDCRTEFRAGLHSNTLVRVCGLAPLLIRGGWIGWTVAIGNCVTAVTALVEALTKLERCQNIADAIRWACYLKVCRGLDFLNPEAPCTAPEQPPGYDTLGLENYRICKEFVDKNICGRVIRSSDPNEKVGRTTSNADNALSFDDLIPYTIHFENVPDATASARDVRIRDPLDPDLDWRKFRLGEVAFGDTTILVPANRSYWRSTVALDSPAVLVEIDAGIDAATGVAHWFFSTTDPATGQPPADPFLGFLPPNDSTGRGQGHVTYTIKAKPGLPDGTEIRNSATIVFDINDPIVTNEVVNVLYRPKADLVFSAMSVESGSAILLTGQTATIKGTVKNAGQGDAGGFLVRVFPNAPEVARDTIGTVLVSALPVGEEAPFALTWVPKWGMSDGQIAFSADDIEDVDETDELNNLGMLIIDIIQTYRLGDLSPDEVLDVRDVVVLIGYTFRNGTAPDPIYIADLNCDDIVDVIDVVVLIDHVFRGRPEPSCSY